MGKMRCVQVRDGNVRRIGVVEEPAVRFVRGFDSLYALAWQALASGKKLTELISGSLSDETVDYDALYQGRDRWKLISPIDHPEAPERLLVSGTGLSHLGSAKDRQSMHAAGSEAPATDSMKMFRWGIEGGKPAGSAIGVAPEWFYKGDGAMLRSHGEALLVPPFGDDGGEEAEIAGIYLIGPDSKPYRIGMAAGNEFSDHVFEKKNYLYLAGSKLRTCSIGPEIAIDPSFQSVPGKVAIERGGKTVWSSSIATGEEEMCHSLRNLEHHHFKFGLHQRPGNLHIHYLGAHSLSFGQGVKLEDGDVMTIQFEGFGRALRNPIRIMREPQQVVEVRPLQ